MTENINSTETNLEEKSSAEAPETTSVSEETPTIESLLESVITERDSVRTNYEKLQEEHRALTERNQALLGKLGKFILQGGAIITSDDAEVNKGNTAAESNASAETYRKIQELSFDDYKKALLDK